jgi:hypothetical protein
MAITVYGSSDDLIEIEGDIEEEFNWYSEGPEEERYLAFSDGTLLSVCYDEDGIWRLKRLVSGLSNFIKEEGDVENDTPDKITLDGIDIKWVLFGDVKIIVK